MFSSNLLLLAGATIVVGTCHESGERWGPEQPYASYLADNVCKMKYTIKEWAIGDALGACYNLDSMRKVDFVLERITSGDSESADHITISEDDCKSGFSSEIWGCDQGGISSYWNWKYT